MPAIPSKAKPLASNLSPLGLRITRLGELLGKLGPIPAEWLEDVNKASKAGTKTKPLECLSCSSWTEVVGAWKRALKWTEGLDCALACMFSSVLSTNLVGEQLWFLVIGPPSSGKTTLLEGLSVNKKYVLSKDTIRGFYSGWKDEQGNDVSLIQEAMGRTLAMKEGDAFIKAPTCQQILSEGRGIYDRVGRVHYRNATANDYEGARMTWIICGTSAIREEIDGSELGARFLCCVVMDGIDDDFEDDVLWRAVNQEARNMLSESNGDASGQHPEELAQAMSLTGGYVSYLRENAVDLISGVSIGEDQLRYCGRLGKFISYMRARPSKKDEHPEREFGARLGKQLTRLAVSIAVVTNDSSLTSTVMNRVKRIGMDTARGLPLQIARRLRYAEANHAIGLPIKSLSDYLNQPEEKIKTLIRFLRHIGVVEQDKRPTAKKNSGVRWKLTGSFLRLYYEVDEG